MPNPLSSVKPRYRIRKSWLYDSWVVHEFYPAYVVQIWPFKSWQDCVDFLTGKGVW